tara:strand:+ start:20296 stop:21645 length:1350 start_codon:yes stop_codon:yes gene_type:complete
MKAVENLKIFILKQISDIKTYGITELVRKFYLLILLSRYLIILPMIGVGIIPCIIIRLISPWLIIRIEKLPASNFGDLLAHPALYYCKKKLNIDQPKKKCLDLIYIPFSEKISNKQIIKMWKRKLYVLPFFLLEPIYKANKIFPGYKTHTIEILTYNSERDIDNLIEKCQPVIEFTNDEEILGKKIMHKFGLNDDDKFMCLAVRDDSYDKKRVSSRFRDWSYQDFRNNNIDNYLLAADELTKRGYYVFRMGSTAAKPFNSKNPKIVDYANSELRSDFMDVYLGAKCSFSIGTQYGVLSLFALFGKANAQISVPFAASHTHNEKYLLLTKHHILKKEKRKLTLSEIFSYGVAFAFDTEIFKQKGIELAENTPEEIKDLAIEIVEIFESKKKLSEEDTKLQKKFQNLFAKNYEISNPIKNLKSYWKKKKVHGQIRASYGTKFLRENKNWLQ